jgi:ectoine hydroxylase-related dioxygenase (phytanoyl-CoA dioxygenase family)
MIGVSTARQLKMVTTTQTGTACPASVRVFSPFRLTTFGESQDTWLQDLEREGYAVVKNAVPADRAAYYQRKAIEWLQTFDPSMDPDGPKTWVTENLPVQTPRNTYEHYSVVHEKFMWEARQEPGVVEAFQKVWGTDELLVSFDALNVTLPNHKKARTPWPHVDQAPRKRGLHCIQGIINLSHAGPEDGSLVVVSGSSKLTEEFFEEHTDPSTWEWKDNRYFDDKDMEWFYARGCKVTKVLAEPGDLILWDSRTIHWGGEPTEKSNIVRTVIYAAYAPARMASSEALAEKRKIFDLFGSTTHWPHDNIKLRELQATWPDGTPDPRHREEPLEKPELSEKLLRLAGVETY